MKTEKIGDLFLTTPCFQIPMYQRNFSWTHDQFAQFWEDLENIQTTHDNLTEHFLGLIVQLNQHNGNSTNYWILDGQQRLTNIILLCTAMRDIVYDIIVVDLPSVASGTNLQRNIMRCEQDINECFIIYVTPGGGSSFPRLIPNKSDRLMYDLISGDTLSLRNLYPSMTYSNNSLLFKESILSSQKNNIAHKKDKIYKCYKYYYDKILDSVKGKSVQDKYSYIFELFQKIRNGLSVMVFDSADANQAYNLFETLNDRGLPLSAMDLIKNKLLEKYDSLNVQQAVIDVINNEWVSIFVDQNGILKGSKTQEYLRVYINSRSQRMISNNEIYKTYQTEINALSTLQDVNDYFNNIKLNAQHFKDIVWIYESNSSGKIEFISNQNVWELLILLRKTKVKQWLSLGLALYREYKKPTPTINDTQIEDMFRLIFNLCFRFKIMDKRFNILEQEFPRLAYCVYSAQIWDGATFIRAKMSEVIEYVITTLEGLISQHVNNADFRNTLRHYIFDENDLAYIILRYVVYPQLPHGSKFTEDGLSLEHVLPEKHQTHWLSHPSADDIKYSIGNMLLVNSGLNSELGNRSFTIKKNIYTKNNVLDVVKSTQKSYLNVQDQVDWSLEFVEKRSCDILIRFYRSLIV